MALLEAGVQEEALKAIARAQTVVIASHIDPDGDALGSSLALALLLRKLGKKVVVYNRDTVPYPTATSRPKPGSRITASS